MSMIKFAHNPFVKIIAITLVVAMLWQDVLWADPEINTTHTLAPQTLLTTEDKALALKKVITGYISMSEHCERLTSINELADAIENVCGMLSVGEGEAPRITGRVLEGAIKITFADGDEIVFYNPKYPFNDEEWRRFFTQGKTVLADIGINDKLRQSFLSDRKSEEDSPQEDIPGSAEEGEYKGRFGKVQDTKERAKGHRYYMIQSGKKRYFYFRWNIFASLEDQILGNIRERKSLREALQSIEEIQAIFTKVKGIKSSMDEADVDIVKAAFKTISLAVGSSGIRRLDKRTANGHVITAMEYYKSGSYEDLRKSYSNLTQAAGFVRHRKQEVENIYERLRVILKGARTWNENTNNRLSRLAQSEEVKTLQGLANRDEVDAPGNEPEFEGVRPLIKGALREMGPKGVPNDKSRKYLKEAKEEIDKANVLAQFIAEFKDSYYGALYAGASEAYEEKVFWDTWVSYLKRSDTVRGSPGYWYARFYQAAFIHRTIEAEHKERISNPLFEASTALIQILKLSDFDSILKAHYVLTKESFPKTRQLVERYKDKKGGKLKNSVYELSVKDRTELVRTIAQDKDLPRPELIALNRCAEMFLFGAEKTEGRVQGRLARILEKISGVKPVILLLFGGAAYLILQRVATRSAPAGSGVVMQHASIIPSWIPTPLLALLTGIILAAVIIKYRRTIVPFVFSSMASARHEFEVQVLNLWAHTQKDRKNIEELIGKIKRLEGEGQFSEGNIDKLLAIRACLLARAKKKISFAEVSAYIEKYSRRQINVLKHKQQIVRLEMEKYRAMSLELKAGTNRIDKDQKLRELDSWQTRSELIAERLALESAYYRGVLGTIEKYTEGVFNYIGEDHAQFPFLKKGFNRRLPGNYYKWSLEYVADQDVYRPGIITEIFVRYIKAWRRFLKRPRVKLLLAPGKWLHAFNRTFGTGFLDHLRRHSVVRTYKKVVLSKPDGSKYIRWPGEQYPITINPGNIGYVKHRTRTDKIMKAIDILEEAGRSLGIPEFSERARRLRNETTILGLIGMKTNLLFANARKGIFRGIHSGRRRNVLYLSTKLLDNLTESQLDMRVLAALLNQGQRFLDKYDLLKSAEGVTAKELHAAFKKEIKTLLSESEGHIIAPELLYSRLYEMDLEDKEVLKREVLPRIHKRIRRVKHLERYLEEEWGDWVPENRTNEFRNDYGKLEKRLEQIGDHLESVGNKLQADEFYRERVRAVKLIQEFEGGLLTIEMQEDIVRFFAHQGMYEEFLKELKALLTGNNFPRPLTKEEQNLRETYIMHHFASLRGEIFYLLDSHKTMAGFLQRFEINSVYSKAEQIFNEFEEKVFPRTPNILEAAEINIEKAADSMELDKAFVDKSMVMKEGFLSKAYLFLIKHHVVPSRNILLIPKKVTTVTFKIPLEDGSIRTFWAFRALQNDARGVGKGGLRWLIVSGETLEEAKGTAVGLATLMSIKNGVIGIPYGGGKGDIVIENEIEQIIRGYEEEAKRLEKEAEELSNDVPKAEGLLDQAKELRDKADRLRARIIRGFARELTKKKAVGTFTDVPAPDMGTGETMMAWFTDEHLSVLAEENRIYEKDIQRRLSDIVPGDDPLKTPYLDEYIKLVEEDDHGTLKGTEIGVVTGKPVGKGGSRGRTKATGFGGFLALKAMLKYFPSMIDLANDSVGKDLHEKTRDVLAKDVSEMTVAIQGSGNVGEYNAWEFHKAGSKVMAFQDVSCTLYNPNGIDIALLDKYLKRQRDGRWASLNTVSKEFLELTGTTIEEKDFFWRKRVDIMALAATQNQITAKNAEGVNCGILLELANNPTSPEADRILRRRGILIIPDVLANVGGVTVSYFEWLQNIEGRYWSEISVDKMLEERINKETKAVLKIAKRDKYNVDLRQAAFILSLARITNAEIARNRRLRKFFRFKRPYKNYSELDLDPETIEELNQIYEEGGFKELIDRDEERHRAEIADITRQVDERFEKGKRGFVLASGPKTSGKIKLAERLRDNLKRLNRSSRCLDIDIELDEYEEVLLKQGIDDEERYRRKIEKLRTMIKRMLESQENAEKGEIIVLQGDYLLGEEVKDLLKDEQTFGIFVNTAPSLKVGDNWPLTSLDLRFMRHILTFNGIFGHDTLDIVKRWPRIREHDLKHVYPTEGNPTWLNADVTFNSYQSYELPVLKPHIQPLLEKAHRQAREEKDQASVKAIEHLLFLLKDVPSINMDERIPQDSIMRQFIGGYEMDSALGYIDEETYKSRLRQGIYALSRNDRALLSKIKTEFSIENTGLFELDAAHTAEYQKSFLDKVIAYMDKLKGRYPDSKDKVEKTKSSIIELCLNIMKYGNGGVLLVVPLIYGGRLVGLRVDSLDNGPGFSDDRGVDVLFEESKKAHRTNAENGLGMFYILGEPYVDRAVVEYKFKRYETVGDVYSKERKIVKTDSSDIQFGTKFSLAWDFGGRQSQVAEDGGLTAESLIANLIPYRNRYSWANNILRTVFGAAIFFHEITHYITAKFKKIEIKRFHLLKGITPEPFIQRGPPDSAFYLSGITANLFVSLLSMAAILLSSGNYLALGLSWYLLITNAVLVLAETTGFLFKKGDIYKAYNIASRKPLNVPPPGLSSASGREIRQYAENMNWIFQEALRSETYGNLRDLGSVQTYPFVCVEAALASNALLKQQFGDRIKEVTPVVALPERDDKEGALTKHAWVEVRTYDGRRYYLSFVEGQFDEGFSEDKVLKNEFTDNEGVKHTLRFANPHYIDWYVTGRHDYVIFKDVTEPAAYEDLLNTLKGRLDTRELKILRGVAFQRLATKHHVAQAKNIVQHLRRSPKSEQEKLNIAEKIAHPFFPGRELRRIKHPSLDRYEFTLGPKTWGKFEMFINKEEDTIYVTPATSGIVDETPREYFILHLTKGVEQPLEYYYDRHNDGKWRQIALDATMPAAAMLDIGKPNMARIIGILREAVGFREEVVKYPENEYFWMEGKGDDVVSYDILDAHRAQHLMQGIVRKDRLLDFYSTDSLNHLSVLAEFGKHSPYQLGEKLSKGYSLLVHKRFAGPADNRSLNIAREEITLSISMTDKYVKNEEAFARNAERMVARFLEGLKENKVENGLVPWVVRVEDSCAGLQMAFNIDPKETVISDRKAPEKFDVTAGLELNKVIFNAEKIIVSRTQRINISEVSPARLLKYGYAKVTISDGSVALAPVAGRQQIQLPSNWIQDMPLSDEPVSFTHIDARRQEAMHYILNTNIEFHAIDEEAAYRHIESFDEFLMQHDLSITDGLRDYNIKDILSARSAVSSIYDNIEWVAFRDKTDTGTNAHFFILIRNNKIIGHGRFRIARGHTDMVDFMFYIAPEARNKKDTAGKKILKIIMANIFNKLDRHVFTFRVPAMARYKGSNRYKDIISSGTPAFFIKSGFMPVSTGSSTNARRLEEAVAFIENLKQGEGPGTPFFEYYNEVLAEAPLVFSLPFRPYKEKGGATEEGQSDIVAELAGSFKDAKIKQALKRAVVPEKDLQGQAMLELSDIEGTSLERSDNPYETDKNVTIKDGKGHRHFVVDRNGNLLERYIHENGHFKGAALRNVKKPEQIIILKVDENIPRKYWIYMDKERIGFVDYINLPEQIEEHIWDINNIAIWVDHDDYRGIGVGTSITNVFTKWAKEENKHLAALSVTSPIEAHILTKVLTAPRTSEGEDVTDDFIEKQPKSSGGKFESPFAVIGGEPNPVYLIGDENGYFAQHQENKNSDRPKEIPEEIKRRAKRIAQMLVNNALPNIERSEGDIILALEDDIGSEELQELIRENIMKQLRRLDRSRGDIKIPNLYIKHGNAEKLDDELFSMKTRGGLKEENIILVAKEASFDQGHFSWLKDKATITCVDDKTFPPDAYLPYLEIVLFTLVKWMSQNEDDIRTYYKLIPNIIPFDELAEEDLRALYEKTAIIRLIPNATRFDHDKTLVDIYEAIQKFLISA